MIDEYRKKIFFVGGSATSLAYRRLTIHQLGANLQMGRIEEAKRPQLPPKDDANYSIAVQSGYNKLFAEIHFYMVSWANCGKMLHKIVGHPKFFKAKKVYDKYKKDFEHYTAGRNSFEHYHDRLPGQKDEKQKMREVFEEKGSGRRTIYLGIKGNYYLHSNSRWDISPKSLDNLNGIILEIVAEIHKITDEEMARMSPF